MAYVNKRTGEKISNSDYEYMSSYRQMEFVKIQDNSFGNSTIIGAVTNSTIAGALLGGSIGGALLGDFLNGGLDD